MKLTVVYRDTRTLVRRKYVASATAAQEASHCVHALMVTQVAVRVLTLINVCFQERVCETERGKEKDAKCIMLTCHQWNFLSKKFSFSIKICDLFTFL